MEWADKSENSKMQRGSSVNFQPVQSAMHAVSHADRTVRPTYLLPPECSLGTVVVVDDRGAVAKTLEAKMALASRQAKAVKGYSPLWEGVMNLRRPEPDEDANAYRAECSQVVKDWCKAYEAMTGHAVLRADVHLDEGHIVEGVTMLNAHAHIICDKTNDKGRVIKMTPQKLRELQTATAEITNLERGVNSRVSGKKHITAHQYKYLAERNQLENQKAVEVLKAEHKAVLDAEKSKHARLQKLYLADTPIITDLKAQIAQLKAQYSLDRDALKASGDATQRAYQALKVAHEGALAELKKSNEKVGKMEKKIADQDAELAEVKAKAVTIINPLREVVEAMGTKITKLTEENAKLAADKARFAAMASAYQAEKAKGTPAHLIVPGEAPSTPNRGAKPGLSEGSQGVSTASLHGVAPHNPIQTDAQRLRQRLQTAPEQPKTQNPDIPTPNPEKSLGEALKATLKEFYQGWVEFIKHKGFTHAEVDVSKGQYMGTILDKDDVFAVQKTGRHTCVIHELEKLDMNPDLENPDILIRYQDGHGQVSGQQPEQYKYPSPGDR
jgi:hypothetical protein